MTSMPFRALAPLGTLCSPPQLQAAVVQVHQHVPNGDANVRNFDPHLIGVGAHD